MPGLRDNPGGKALQLANARLAQTQAELKQNGHQPLADEVFKIRNKILAAMGLEPLPTTSPTPAVPRRKQPPAAPLISPATPTADVPPSEQPKASPPPAPRRDARGRPLPDATRTGTEPTQ